MCLNLNEYTSLKQVIIVTSQHRMKPIVTINQNLQQKHKNPREKNTSIPLKKIMKPQGKKLKEEGKNREELQKEPENK